MDAGGRTNQETESRKPEAADAQDVLVSRRTGCPGVTDVQEAQVSRIQGCTGATAPDMI